MNKRWIILAVLIGVVGISVNTCFHKKMKQGSEAVTTPVTESKVMAVALDQNSIPNPTPEWQRNKDAWYEQAAKADKKPEAGDEENKTGEVSLM